MKPDSLIHSLLNSGTEISITCGLLSVGLGGDLLSLEQRAHILIELSELLKQPVLQYEGYSTGCYMPPHAEGVTLQFLDLRTSVESYCIFNADLKRKRSSRYGKAGDKLPPGRFSVRKKHLFYKFWLGTGKPLPPRLSSFHDYMGKLKPVLFTASYGKGARLVADSLRPLEISHEQIMGLVLYGALPDKEQLSSGQLSDSVRTNLPDSESQEGLNIRSFQPDSGAGQAIHGTSKQVDTVISNTEPLSNVISPVDQSVEEWLADYDSGLLIIT